MQFLANNWALIVAIVAVIATAAFIIIHFYRLPKEEQIEKVKQWLLWAVTQAEKQLGSGTGQLKLRYVYDMFIMRFPYISRFVTFDMFSMMVDEALDKMRELLETNKQIENYVNE